MFKTVQSAAGLFNVTSAAINEDIVHKVGLLVTRPITVACQRATLFDILVTYFGHLLPHLLYAHFVNQSDCWNYFRRRLETPTAWLVVFVKRRRLGDSPIATILCLRFVEN